MDLISSHKQLKKIELPELAGLLKTTREELASSDFTAEDIQQKLNTLLEKTNQKPAVLFSLIRIATTWSPASPSLAESLQVLGKEKSLARIDQSYATLVQN